MCAVISSSARASSGDSTATASIAIPAAKQSSLHVGSGRPASASLTARTA